MAKVEVVMCDDCKKVISKYQCDFCKCDLCNDCTNKLKIRLNFPNHGETDLFTVNICRKCSSKHRFFIQKDETYTLQFREEYKNQLLNYLLKNMVVEKL